MCCDVDSGPVLEEDVKASLEVFQNVSTYRVEAGSPVIIEGLVRRNKVDSFLKIEFKIPGSPSWRTEGIESDGGTYNRKEDSVTYRWLRVPLDKSEFKVKFRVYPPEGFAGKFSVRGNYYYIQNETKLEQAIVPKEIVVTSKSS
jgi:hypothetical protein